MIYAFNRAARQFLAKPSPPVTTQVVKAPRTKTVLVADDEDSVRAFAALVINALGYKAITARNGKEAVELLLDRKGREPIDLLITDLMMPAMSGKELAMRIWDKFPAQRVVFFSGYSEQMARRMWKLDDRMSFLQKPFSSHALASRVREALGDAVETVEV